MHRIAKFLKGMFAMTNRPLLPATSSETTLHDALRICAGGVHVVDRAASTRNPLRQIDVCRYHSEIDLRDHLHRFDRAPRRTANLTMILALDDDLRGNLRELIRRRSPAYRLVIVPRAGHWPGIDSFGDLALASTSLGWNLIEMCRDLGDALKVTVSAFGEDERLLVVLPAGTPG